MPTTIEFRSVAHAGEAGAPVIPSLLDLCRADGAAFRAARAAVEGARVAADRTVARTMTISFISLIGGGK